MRRINSWPAAPFARFLIPFCGGITWVVFFPGLNQLTLLTASAISAFTYLLSHLFLNRLGYRGRVVPGLLLCITIFCSGAAWTLLCKADRQPDFFYAHLQPNSILAVRLTEPLQEKAKSFKVLAKVEAVHSGNERKAVTGSLLVYLKKDGLLQKPGYGDILLLENKVRPLESPRNPGEFDYASYLANRQVYHRGWYEAGEWKATGMNKGKTLWSSILAYRQKLLGEVEHLILTDEERGIAKALLLGEDQELDPHLRATYAGTGTLHVLSVSGMHVGILFFLLRYLFKPLTRSRGGRLLRITILLAFLWGYAMLTGLSPSVARSAAMLSLIVIGLDYRRVTNIYNIIAASAFGLLLIDPYLLTQISFQLSYAAILGIVWLQPQIVKHWQPRGWLLKHGWEIIAASIAAQITTFPLGLLYFSQFPVYFLLSNLIIIPISSLALIAGCLWLFLASIPWVDTIAILPGYITYALIDGMNWCAELLAGLPYATLNELYIGREHFIILCTAIVLLALALQYRRRSMLFSGAFCSVVFFCGIVYSRYHAFSGNRLTVHAIDKIPAVSVKEGGKIYLLADSAVKEPDMIKYHFAGFFNQHYVSRKNVIHIPDTVSKPVSGQSFYYKSPYGQFGNQKFLWLSHGNQLTSLPKGTEVDFLILSRDIKVGLGRLREKVSFRKLIITADNKSYRSLQWEEECRKAGIACVNLKKNHSFTLTE